MFVQNIQGMSVCVGHLVKYQPIGVAVHSHCVHNFEYISGEGLVAMDWKRYTIIPEHPVPKIKR